MCLGLRGGHLPSVLWIAIALSIGFVQRAHAENFAEGARQAAAGQEVLSQNPARQQADYAVAAEAFRNGIAREPGSAAAWTQWADFALERFRILDLQLRSAQSGMARVLRFEAQGWHSGPETREELLRQSATADPEQQGIWGELGVEQEWRGRQEEAAATLKTALERQPNESWTLRLQAVTAAAEGNWGKAEAYLVALGVRSRAVLRSALKVWPKSLLPNESAKGEAWECARKDSEACFAKIKFPPSEIHASEEQFFAEERWEHLVAMPEPRRDESGQTGSAGGACARSAPTRCAAPAGVDCHERARLPGRARIPKQDACHALERRLGAGRDGHRLRADGTAATSACVSRTAAGRGLSGRAWRFAWDAGRRASQIGARTGSANRRGGGQPALRPFPTTPQNGSR